MKKVICPECDTENEIDANHKFCKECGTDLSEYIYADEDFNDNCKKDNSNSIIKNISLNIRNVIVFLIYTVILSAIGYYVLIGIFTLFEGLRYSDTVFQQIYNMILDANITLFLGLGVIFGLILTLISRNTAQLNRIEKEISQLQNNIKYNK